MKLPERHWPVGKPLQVFNTTDPFSSILISDECDDRFSGPSTVYQKQLQLITIITFLSKRRKCFRSPFFMVGLDCVDKNTDEKMELLDAAALVVPRSGEAEARKGERGRNKIMSPFVLGTQSWLSASAASAASAAPSNCQDATLPNL